jgi:DNA invertase Pin-like site-specific DNA recombinase
MAELTVRQARELLADWAVVVRSRDERVRTAVASGLSKSEVSRLTGIARSTIHRILDSAQDGSATAQGEGAGL